MSDKNKPIKVQCINCNRETNHDIAAQHSTRFSSPDGDYDVWQGYQIAVCRGCDTVSFVHISVCLEDFDPYTGEPITSTTVYPDRASGRTPVQGDEHFPPKTRKIYLEVIKAMNTSSPLLAAIGLRTLIESICIDQKTTGKTLEKRIAELGSFGLSTEVVDTASVAVGPMGGLPAVLSVV